MRLWHKDLIPVLPRQQLLSQWRECCCIARNIAVNGTPNHILVNKVLDYDLSEFYNYTSLICIEMERRGYKVNKKSYRAFTDNLYRYVRENGQFEKFVKDTTKLFIDSEHLFKNWHTERYLYQCYFNLEEKYDCGGITDEEWQKIHKLVSEQAYAIIISDETPF